ncbi:hypothetical protein ACWNYQ_00645 [Candidatus Vidania fulgoroideorum]
MKEKNNIFAIILFNNKQYIMKNRKVNIKSELIKKKKIIVNKILLIKINNKIYIAKPFIKNLLFDFYFLKNKIIKNKIIKFKRRKRYKLIKSHKKFNYIFLLNKIKWLKKKQ